jgi:ubiquinol-cytochrome c reductase cytochrome b subunit
MVFHALLRHAARYRGTLYKAFLAGLIASFVVLGLCGVFPTSVWSQFPRGWPIIGGLDVATFVARVFAVIYFAFFLLMPWYGAADKTKPEPERVTR